MKRLIGILLLAIICIGGTELLVCRVVEPELYRRLTAPVWAKVTVVAEEVSEAGAQFVTRLLPEEKILYAFGPSEEEEDMAGGSDWQEPAMTTLRETELGEVLTGGSWEVAYFRQMDDQWKDLPYGSDTIGKYGCGPTVMAMAVSTLSEQKIDPGEMALWAKQHGYWAKKSGSYLSIVKGTAKSYGLSVASPQEITEEHLLQALSAGNLAIALMGDGHFTDGGHFILLRGVTLNGEILVADPSSRERSLMTWDPQLIIDELSGSRNSGAPLWYLSASENL